MIYAYAAVDDLEGLPVIRGLAGERVGILTFGRLQMAVGALRARPAPEEHLLKGHDRVVRRLARSAGAVLPLRFGTVFADETALRRALRGRVPGLRQALRRVHGCEQMTLRVAGTLASETEAPRPEAAGSHYLHERAARFRLLGLDPLRAALAPLVKAERVEARPSGTLLASVYHLVPRGSARRYRSTVARQAGKLGDLRLSLSGPWPCYAFAETAP